MHFKSRPTTDRYAERACAAHTPRSLASPPFRLLPLAVLVGAALQVAPAWAEDVAPEQNADQVAAEASGDLSPAGGDSSSGLFGRIGAALNRVWLLAQAPGAGGAPVPPVAPTPKVESEKPPAPAVEAASGGPKFEIRKFEVEGVTLLPPAKIDATVKPYTGAGRDFSDVQKALEALEKLFVDQGFGSVQVLLPEQELDQGVVKFKVIEPKLGKVTIEGNKEYSDANIRASLPALKEGSAPNSNEIAANLRLANENPGKGSTVLLRAGSNEGEVDAVVRVTEDKVTRFNFTLDNTGAGGSGIYRVGLGMQTSNVFGRDHVFAAQAITSPDERNQFKGYSRDVAIFGAQYHVPLYRTGDSMDFTVGYSNVNSGVVQNIFNVSGRGSVAGVRYSHNLPKWGNIEHKVIWSWDYRAYRNNVTPVAGGQQIIPNITVRPMSLTYAATHRGQNDETSGYLSFSQNVPGGGDGGSANFDASRPGARPGYRLLRYGVTHLRSFTGDWQARINIAGQYTTDLLVSGEQFGIGGANSVRGFNERQFANDYGVSANFEFYTPDLAPLLKLDSANKVRLVAFYDTGHVVRNEPLRNDTARTTAKGTGLGLRYTHGTNLSFKLDAAFAALPSNTGGDSTNGPATPTQTSLKQFRMHGALVYLF